MLVYAQGPNAVDFALLRYLNRQGFNVDYAGRVGQQAVPLTWEMVKNYNCLVISLVQPGPAADTKLSTGNSKVVQRFLQAGGGVMLAPDLMMWDEVDRWRGWAEGYGQPFGAWFLRGQTLAEADAAKVAVGGYFSIRYHYTENILAHPVTQGVKRIWYPIYGNYLANGQTRIQTRGVSCYPLRPDANWTVLVRGSDTASTQANVAEEFPTQTGTPMNSREEIKSAPALFAVRDYGAGRMTFFAMNAEFHFTAGMHHNKGGDMEALRGGYNLERGFDTRPSDFLKLLVNSLRWMAEPSLRNGAVGGYQQDAAKLDEPLAPPTDAVDWENAQFPNHNDLTTMTTESKSPDFQVFKGVIGAQTALSGGAGTVADYKRAALAAGLRYVVFLEDFVNMTPAKLEQLVKDCAAQSDDKVLLLPGYHLRDNRGHHLFLFGRNGGGVPWPSNKGLLTDDGKLINAASQAGRGGLPFLDFAFGGRLTGVNEIGYFDLPSSPITRMWNLKVYSAVGLFHYADNQPVDGMKENFRDFLEVNNAGCNIKPYSISLISSPEGLSRAVARGEMLTYVRATKLADIDSEYGGIRYDYLSEPYVFVSNGPEILDWSCRNRDCVVHAESFVTPNYRWQVRLKVRSDVGLAEIKVWDGLKTYLRILPGGAQDYERVFELNHNQQKNLILEVTDTQGRKAVSAEQFDRNHLNMHYWCGDRINGALKHGPLYFFGAYGESGIDFVSKGQDSFNLFASPGASGDPESTKFVSSAGTFQNSRLANRPLQGMVSEDGGVYLNNCCAYYPDSEPIVGVWGTYGPLVDTSLYDLNQRYVNFRDHYARANPYNPSVAGISNPGDIVPGLNVEEYRFKADQVLEQLPVGSFTYGSYWNIKGNDMTVALCRSPRELPVVFTLNDTDLYSRRLTPLLNDPAKPFRIERGGYFAAFGSKGGAATRVGYNVCDVPFIVKAENGGIVIYADVKGRQVKAGDSLTIATLGLIGQVPYQPVSATRYDRVAEYLGLNGTPGYQLALSRGEQRPVSVGFCDLTAKDGAVAFDLPKSSNELQLALPVRVFGLNDKWSAYFYDKAKGQARPLGVYEGIGYARLDPFYQETQAALGHPVTADNPDVVIVLTVLADGKYPIQKDGKLLSGQGLYALQVNNPTDQDLTVTLTNNMDLPGFPFKTKTLALQAGEFVDVLPAAGVKP
ncbi:MAG TPA: hypothetical protein VGM19_00395 [Armatimonadota bacterium]